MVDRLSLQHSMYQHASGLPCCRPSASSTNPGYPLLTILHHLLSRLVRTDVLQVLVRHPPTVCSNSAPGAVALAANLLAAVLGAATAVSMAVAVEEWTIGVGKVYNRGAAAAGALLFSLSPLAWEYNTGSEVFALNNFLVALAVVIAVRAARQPNVKEARIGAAVSSRTCYDGSVLVAFACFCLFLVNVRFLLFPNCAA